MELSSSQFCNLKFMRPCSEICDAAVTGSNTLGDKSGAAQDQLLGHFSLAEELTAVVTVNLRLRNKE